MGLQPQELRDLVHNEIHIDEFRAKMGDDSDMAVLSFKVKYKAPAMELERFFETGYDWIRDAEVSAGELGDGWYLVYVELDRRSDVPEQIMEILSDMKNLTNVKSWRFRYGAGRERGEEWAVTPENVRRVVPLSPREYRNKIGRRGADPEIEALQSAAGIGESKVTKEHDPELAGLKVAAGIY